MGIKNRLYYFLHHNKKKYFVIDNLTLVRKSIFSSFANLGTGNIYCDIKEKFKVSIASNSCSCNILYLKYSLIFFIILEQSVNHSIIIVCELVRYLLILILDLEDKCMFT